MLLFNCPLYVVQGEGRAVPPPAPIGGLSSGPGHQEGTTDPRGRSPRSQSGLSASFHFILLEPLPPACLRVRRVPDSVVLMETCHHARSPEVKDSGV